MQRRHVSRLALLTAAGCAIPLVLASPAAAGADASDQVADARPVDDDADAELAKDEIAAIESLAEQANMHGIYIMRMRSAGSCAAAVRLIRNTYGWSAHCHGRNLYVVF